MGSNELMRDECRICYNFLTVILLMSLTKSYLKKKKKKEEDRKLSTFLTSGITWRMRCTECKINPFKIDKRLPLDTRS